MKTSVSQLYRIVLLILLLALVVQIPLQAQWIRKANAFKTRSEVSSVVYNNKLYTFIGFGTTTLEAEPTSEVYDPATNTWTLLASMPTGKTVTHQGVALVDNTVWHIGGRVGKNPGPLTSEIWIYNLTTNTWSAGPQIRDPATGNPLLWAGGGAVLLGRTLHIFGGFVINACNNDQDKYHLTLDIDKWLANPAAIAPWANKLMPMPIKRNHLSTTVLGGKIYVMGGQFGHDCGGGLDKPHCHVYNPATDTWTELAPLPTARSHAEGGIFAMDGKIYLVAGQGNGGSSTNKVTIFNPEANNGLGSWIEDASLVLPNGYEGVSAKVIGNTFIISHGGIGSSSNPTNQTYSRTIVRNPVYKLGVSASCLDLKVPSGSKATAKNLLFTIDGTKNYTTTSDASWLTVSKNANGTAIPSAVDIEVSINASGLAPGNYKGTINISGIGEGPAYSGSSFCVNLTVDGTTPLLSTIRINAGGAATTVNGLNWLGCTGTTACNNYVSGGFAFTQNPLPTITGATAPANQSILQSEWTGGQTNGVPAGQVAFTYTIPVNNGNYTVRLHFVELNKNGPGLRLFDVNIEGGTKELTNFDIFAQAGGIHKAITRDFPVSISDGSVTIQFIRQVENAKIGAIEILPAISQPVETNYQAEQATLYQAKVSTQHAGYTGTGFVDYINASSDFIEWTLNQPAVTSATLKFRYANGSTSGRALRLEINGIVVNENLNFPPTGSWTTWILVNATANLNAGVNKVKLIAKGASGPNLDYLAVATSTNLRIAAIEETNMALQLSVYPNPASTKAKLVFTGTSQLPLQIQIIDVSGKVHQTHHISAKGTFTETEISVRQLPAGMYIIHTIQGSKTISGRLRVD